MEAGAESVEAERGEDADPAARDRESSESFSVESPQPVDPAHMSKCPFFFPFVFVCDATDPLTPGKAFLRALGFPAPPVFCQGPYVAEILAVLVVCS
jgi:hypothetical protein